MWTECGLIRQNQETLVLVIFCALSSTMSNFRNSPVEFQAELMGESEDLRAPSNLKHTSIKLTAPPILQRENMPPLAVLMTG